MTYLRKTYLCMTYLCMTYLCMSYLCMTYPCMTYLCMTYLCMTWESCSKIVQLIGIRIARERQRAPWSACEQLGASNSDRERLGARGNAWERPERLGMVTGSAWERMGATEIASERIGARF